MNDIFEITKATEFYTKHLVGELMLFAAQNVLLVVFGRLINCTKVAEIITPLHIYAAIPAKHLDKISGYISWKFS
ncbi:MAG TPA: hypothetical protein VLQ91_05955 [Draconibacterium sp.]|nr:hypothetical protein [Draconibacterium sp.]